MIDPTFELLWKKVGEAYQQVSADANKSIEIEHEKYRVQVYRGAPTGNSKSAVYIVISDDVKPKPPTLIAP